VYRTVVVSGVADVLYWERWNPRLIRPLILAVVAGLLTACGDGGSPNAPSETPGRLTETLETAGITFHFAPGDSVNAPWQQAFHEWATTLLGVAPPAKVQYYKYRNEAAVRELSGASSTRTAWTS
jgi:hypothetical protein